MSQLRLCLSRLWPPGPSRLGTHAPEVEAVRNRRVGKNHDPICIRGVRGLSRPFRRCQAKSALQDIIRAGHSATRQAQIAAGQLDTVTVNNGKAGLKIHGIPNYSYVVERTTNMVDWVLILTTNAASNGTIVFEDEFGDLPSPPASAYYRIKCVQ